MYVNYEYDGYKIILLKEDQNDIRCFQRKYVVRSKNGEQCKIFAIPNELLNNNAEVKIRFYNIIQEIKRQKQFPCDCYACGAELNEYGMPKYKDVLGNRITLEQMDKQMNYKQMTREEAHKLAFNAAKNLEGKEVSQIIKVLEVLGLIKFEEEKKEDIVKRAKEWKPGDTGAYYIIKDLLIELDKRPKIGDKVWITIEHKDVITQPCGILVGKHNAA